MFNFWMILLAYFTTCWSLLAVVCVKGSMI